MKELYPENFVAIAVHVDDEMTPSNQSYSKFFESVPFVPCANLNRTAFQHMGLYDIEDIIDMGEARIKASASFGEDLKVNISTETEFGFNDKGNDCYRIAYVVLEDNVGPYFQTNYYSNPDSPDNPDDYLNWWIHQNDHVMTIYNDVARGIYDYDGIQGLFPENITEGEIYKSEYTITLPDGIDDASNLKIVTLLIDVRSGEILNADCTHIDGEVPDINNTIPIESVAINPSSAEMKVGENLTLTATVMPEDATDTNVVWSSDNKSVATVNAHGYVEAVGAGEAVITATCGDKSDICRITVLDEDDGVESVFTDKEKEVDLYDINGMLLKSHIKIGDLKSIPSGIYIIRTSGIVKKLVIR